MASGLDRGNSSWEDRTTTQTYFLSMRIENCIRRPLDGTVGVKQHLADLVCRTETTEPDAYVNV